MLTKRHLCGWTLSALLVITGCEVHVDDQLPNPNPVDAAKGTETGEGSSGSHHGGEAGAPHDSTLPSDDSGRSDAKREHHPSDAPPRCTCEVGSRPYDGGKEFPFDAPDVAVTDCPEPELDGAVDVVTDGAGSGGAGDSEAGNGGASDSEAGSGGAGDSEAGSGGAGDSEAGLPIDVTDVRPEDSQLANDANDTGIPQVRWYGPYYIDGRGLLKIDLSTIKICDSCTLSFTYYHGFRAEAIISGSLNVITASRAWEAPLAQGPQSGKTLSIINEGDDYVDVSLTVRPNADAGVPSDGGTGMDSLPDAVVDAPQTTKRTLAVYFLGGETVDLSTLDICPSCELHATVGQCIYTTEVQFSGAVDIRYVNDILHPSRNTHPSNDVLLGNQLGPRTGSILISNASRWRGERPPVFGGAPCAIDLTLWTKPTGT